MTKKKVKKETFIEISADYDKLQEMANKVFESKLEAETFFKGMVYTGFIMWMLDDPRTQDEEDILIDTLTAIIYVQP